MGLSVLQWTLKINLADTGGLGFLDIHLGSFSYFLSFIDRFTYYMLQKRWPPGALHRACWLWRVCGRSDQLPFMIQPPSAYPQSGLCYLCSLYLLVSSMSDISPLCILRILQCGCRRHI